MYHLVLRQTSELSVRIEELPICFLSVSEAMKIQKSDGNKGLFKVMKKEWTKCGGKKKIWREVIKDAFTNYLDEQTLLDMFAEKIVANELSNETVQAQGGDATNSGRKEQKEQKEENEKKEELKEKKMVTTNQKVMIHWKLRMNG